MAEGGENLERESKKEAEETAKGKVMTPWEQHSSVISIPRFDYKAPSSLLRHSHSGFLVTCTIKREKSATKEAMSILGKYDGFFNCEKSESLESSDSNSDSKRRKMCTDETDGKCVNDLESKTPSRDAGGLSKDDCLSPAKTDTCIERDSFLSLVKLTKSGLLLLTFPEENSLETVDIVLNIFQSLESGGLRSPLWCHRIFPIQATCNLNEKELQSVVSKLVLRFVNDKHNKLSWPVKFAVGYNRRGIEETHVKNSKDTLKDSDPFALLDRDKCFGVVAAAVKDAVSNSVVDLKSPEVAVLVELLPLSGVPKGSLVAAVSVLPQNLVSAKPRLCIKALVSDTNARNGKC